MSHSITWDSAFAAVPAATDLVSGGDEAIRNLKTGIQERIAKDHYMTVGGTNDDHGEHEIITFHEPVATPSSAANKGKMYVKDVSAKAELHFLDEDGNEVQITAAGAINVASAIFDIIYPVGSIYTSIVPTNPGTLMGYGTWVAFGAGKTLVGLDATDTDFDVSEETGGAKTVDHTHTTVVPPDGWTATSGIESGHIAMGLGSYSWGQIGQTASRTLTSSSPSASSVVQPYIVVYFWKRTA